MITKTQLLAEIEALHDKQCDQAQTIRDMTAQIVKLKKRIKKQDETLREHIQEADTARKTRGEMDPFSFLADLAGTLADTGKNKEEEDREDEKDGEDPCPDIRDFAPAIAMFLNVLCRDTGKDDEADQH